VSETISTTDEQLAADPFLQLLTDALRAGPGSPEWQQAVARVNAGEKGPGDEYALLVQARENLAAGKAYREVKPGVGFTRKLFSSIATDTAAAKKNPLSASLISYIGAGLVVATIGVILFWLTQGTGESEELATLLFANTRLSTDFKSALPTGWKTFGPLVVDPAKGLMPTWTGKSDKVLGGGVVSTDAMRASEPFQVEATFQFQKLSDDIIPQLFVTDDPDFSKETGISPHELVWEVSGKAQHVALPETQLLTSVSRPVVENQNITVRIVVGVNNAVILSDGNVLWTGASQLARKPRYVGVRLLCRGEGKDNRVIVKQLRVMTK